MPEKCVRTLRSPEVCETKFSNYTGKILHCDEYTDQVIITTYWLNGRLHREDGPSYIEEGKKYFYYKHGLLHKEDGPAETIYKNGTCDKFWYWNGLLHREDGPAVEYANEDKIWYLNGKVHRADGPAIERANGSKSWYLNGDMLSEEEWTYTVRQNKLRRFLDTH